MTISLAVLFSGGGRTVLNLLDYIDRGELDAKISLAIASKEGIVGIDRLTDRGIEVGVAKINGMSNEEGDARTNAWLEETKPDLICLCGYLRLLQIQPWMEGKVLNIHPSLLPAHGGKGMYGDQVHKLVLLNKERQSGITIHLVNEHYDEGKILFQKSCKVITNDEVRDLAERIHQLEYQYFPKIIEDYINRF